MSSKSCLVVHPSQIHDTMERINCRHCGKQIVGGATELARHKEIVHGGRTSFTCLECGMVFNSRGVYQKHMGSHGSGYSLIK